MPTLWIYGATGYTAGLVVDAALAAGLRPALAGRDAARVGALARRLGLDHAAFAVGAGAARFAAGDVVLNAAGPFRDTWAPMVDACLRAGAHYLDLSGEVDALAGVAGRDRDARDRGVMLMPGAGFDVVPSDCLCALAASRLGAVARIRLGVAGLELASRGSLRTLARDARAAVVRRGGALTRVPVGSLAREFDYGAGPRRSALVAWGDVVTAHYTTGAPDIEVYFELTPALVLTLSAPWSPPAALAELAAGFAPPGPSPAERAARRATLVVEAEDPQGRVARARAVTPEAYTLSAASAVAIAARALRGDLEAGFQTPARVYGHGLARTLPGVSMALLP